ncbi:MAG TPA: glutaredoxin [Kofleriaceae bacterium]|jgi:glutaredoxin 3|nr:glutaredoxin [Kofleriaceae bacterium]
MQATETAKKLTKQATEKLFAALNRADEIGGEIRDYVQDKMATDPRYVAARKRLAQLLGKDFESKAEATAKATAKAEARAAVAATTPTTKAAKGLGDPSIKAQIYGKKSCPWSGRAITLLEKHKVDFDFVDLEEPEHEEKALALSLETKQTTVPYVYLRGQFIGGFNALSEVERLGQLEVALMTPEERASAPAHLRNVEIVPRPNTDEVAPGESDASAE